MVMTSERERVVGGRSVGVTGAAASRDGRSRLWRVGEVCADASCEVLGRYARVRACVACATVHVQLCVRCDRAV